MIIEKRDYYNHGAIEAIDAIESACAGLTGYDGFLTGNCLKYLFRWRWKGHGACGFEESEILPRPPHRGAGEGSRHRARRDHAGALRTGHVGDGGGHEVTECCPLPLDTGPKRRFWESLDNRRRSLLSDKPDVLEAIIDTVRVRERYRTDSWERQWIRKEWRRV